MDRFIKKYWVLLAVLAVFIFFKVPHLFYPYYWDESWPYAAAIKQMAHNGASLMPGAIGSDLSRGHPLFFHATAALWVKVFGGSRLAMHSFALTISILFLVAIYMAGLRLFSRRVATIGLLLVATQVVFFVQSSFLLLEVLVAFLCFLSLYFYARDKYALAAICLSALFYTKESGLVMGLVLGLHALAGVFSKAVPARVRLYRLLSVGVPCVLIGIFFLVQKHVMGWYVFPMHLEFIEHSWKMYWYKFRMACIRVAFYEDLKFYYFVLLMLLAVIAAIKNRAPRYLAILLPGACIYYFVDDMRAGRLLPSIPFFIVFILSVGYFLFVYGSNRSFGNGQQRKFIVLGGAFILCFICFSTFNYFTYRYLLAVIVLLLFISAAFFDMLVSRIAPMLYLPVVACLLLIGFFSFRLNNSYGDADLGAFDGMDVEQGIVGFLEQRGYYGKAIYCGSFLERLHLTDTATGFLQGGRAFTNVEWEFTPAADCLVFTSIEEDKKYAGIKKDTSFHLAYRCEKGMVWGEVYEKSKPAIK